MAENQDTTKPASEAAAETVSAPSGWVRFSRILIWLLALFLAFFLLFQIPAVQTWTLRQVTRSLSNKLHTKVEVGYFRLGFFNRLILEDVYVEDLDGDTLLYSRGLTGNLNLSPFVLARRGLVVRRLRLFDTKLHIRRKHDEFETNLNLLLSHIRREDAAKENRESNFQIDLDQIKLGTFTMLKMDSLKNQLLELGLNSARIRVDDIDLPGSTFDLEHVYIDGPRVRIDDYTRSPRWEDFLALPTEKDSGDLRINAEQIAFENGIFALHNYRKAPVKETPDSILDYKHMEVFDITFNAQDFSMHRDTFTGHLGCLTFQDSSGFELHDFSANAVRVDPNKVELYGMRLQTANTLLRDTLRLRYSRYKDFEDFPEKVIIDAKFRNSDLAMQDVITFAPGLNGKPFFEKNRNRRLRLDADFRGTVNNLDGRNLRLVLDDGSRVNASFGSRNLAKPGENSMNIRFTRLDTYVGSLRRILPNFDVPANFDRLGALSFTGGVDIIFSDVITDGELQTSIGNADVDIKIRDMALGKERTNYVGQIDLHDFDLAAWTLNPDFGKVDLSSQVQNGVGLTAKSAYADLSASINRFDYKGYTYRNAQLTGVLNASQFDGAFTIADENIDFNFEGVLDASGDTPKFDFRARVEHLDLQALNLSETPLELNGNVFFDLRNRSLANLTGTVTLDQINMIKETRKTTLDHLEMETFFLPDSNKVLRVRSDLMDANLNGHFEIDRLPNYLAQYLSRHYPTFARKLRLPAPDSLVYRQDVDFSIHVKNSKGFQGFLVPDMSDLRDARLSGLFSNVDSVLEARLQLPYLEIGKLRIQELEMRFEADGETGNLDLGLAGVAPNARSELAPLSLLTYFTADSLQFGLTYVNNGEKAALQEVQFDGCLLVKDTNVVALEMDNSKLRILDEDWRIGDENSILFKKDSILVEEFAALQPERTARLTSLEKRGLALQIENLDFAGLNRQLKYEPLQFDGAFNALVQTGDLLELSDIRIQVGADSMIINGDDWGAFELIGQMDDVRQPLVGFLTMTNDTTQLLVDAIYNVNDIGERPEEAKGYFKANLNMQSFPLDFAEYFIGGTISEATGGFDARLNFSGQFDRPKVFGNIHLGPGGINLNYLKTRYTFDEVGVVVDDYLFDATGAVLYDRFGNSAEIVGGIRHDHLSNMGFDARLFSERFLGLNTVKGDNELFYGRGLGSAEIFFTGTFKQPDIYVNATVGEGTRISIPVTSERKASELSFIRFVDRDREEMLEEDRAGEESYDLKGVSLEMDLVATNAAEIEIIFNEQVGDIIEGRGYGALRISVPRNGDFQMYGDYTIDNGDYLFTLYNLVNKKFSIRKGGTISWTGDPYAANIDITANYSDLNTSVANFIQEYLLSASAELKNDASEPTDIDLFLKLSGELLRPTINFDLAFPNLQGELATYVESKLRVLKQDQNELSKQVFGLIVAGQFLPAEINLQGTEIIYNTVGEFLSNQLSLLLTELFSEFIGEGRTLSSVDFDIAYSQYQNVDLGEEQNINRGNELNLSLKQNFFNDRLSVQVGGNIDLDGSARAAANSRSAFVGNDLKFELEINEERNLKLRIFQRLEPDIGGRKLEIGAGLSYRKEFDSFGEFLGSVRNKGQSSN